MCDRLVRRSDPNARRAYAKGLYIMVGGSSDRQLTAAGHFQQQYTHTRRQLMASTVLGH